MKIVHVGAELLKSTGGTTKAVSDFQFAIPGSAVLALCDQKKLTQEGPYDSSWNYIATSRSTAGELYLKSTAAETVRAVQLAAGASAVFSHMLYRYNSNLATSIARAHSIPYFVVPHGSLDPYVLSYGVLQKKAWLWIFGNRFLRRASAVVCATRRELEKAKRAVRFDNGCVLHWPVDMREEGEFDKKKIRAQLGLPTDSRLLISFGRYHTIKRTLELINIFNNMELKNIGLVLVGPDDNVTLADCLERAREGMVKNVFCFPAKFGEDLRSVVGACDGYISWSYKENFNYTLAESLAAGLPVIVSRGNDLSLELGGVGCGWMLEDDLEPTLIRAVEDFARVPDSRLRDMGMQGRRFAERSLSREAFSDELHGLVDSVIRDHRRTRAGGLRFC